MDNWKPILVVILTIVLFWFLKFYLNFPSADIDTVGVVLTMASILFGFLAGFFISELWTRYTEIRELQGTRSAEALNMIKSAEYFYRNSKFERAFKRIMEKASVVDETVEWNEGHLEIPVFRKIGDSFKSIKVKSSRDQIYFQNILNRYNELVEATVKLDTLGKEKLFPSEWFIMIILSVIISLSVLFLDPSHIFYKIIILIFPVIISLSLLLLYNLDTLLWSKERVSLEPNARIFDAIGVKRFYLSQKKKFLSKQTIDYRTEHDLKGDLKQAYNSILKSRIKSSK